MYDLVIIGGGPAGVAAGIYASRKHLKTLFLTFAVEKQLNFGGQSVVSQDIQNWIGTKNISGTDLAKNLEEHLREYADEFVDIKTDAKVNSISHKKLDDHEVFTVLTDSGDNYKGKSVLITTGSTRRKLTVPGANEFEHKGITYCASCDGPLFSDKDVSVIGGGNAGFETAAQLLAYTKSVTLFDHSDTFKADPITVKKVLNDPKMTGINDVDLLEVCGDKFVTGLKYRDLKTDTVVDHKTDGVFVEIGLLPATSFVEWVITLNKYKQIEIDPWTQRTSLTGIWSAGDCTNVRYHQNNIAVGDAVRALEDIYVYLKT